MRAIMLMFDTLNRRYLPPYGAEGVHAPNFERLARRTVTFDTSYAGSMPCMPARREIHTGRYNFLHASWGPLEPFDDSVPRMLSQAGIYTHLTTDHWHYWEDGGSTYHGRYNSHEFFRGQEFDKWKGHVGPLPDVPRVNRSGPLAPHAAARAGFEKINRVNRMYQQTPEQHSQTLTVDAGMQFIETNAAEDSWFLQIECFDPHEPFFTYDEYRKHYAHDYDGPEFDWPDYARVSESAKEQEHLRAEYLALLTQCDASLGRVLDAMDEHDLWDDTLLIVNTDHGLLLGEHGWWGKISQPWYDENIHTPLFVWDPRYKVEGERRDALVQTIDIGPTLLDFFDLPTTPDMQGASLGPVIAEGRPIREAGLFGSYGAHVNVTDGRYVYMRSCVTPDNGPLEEYTLLPLSSGDPYSPAELHDAELSPPLGFTKGVPVLRLRGSFGGHPWSFGTLLFDVEEDPHQMRPLVDDALELRMANLLVELMRDTDAPVSQYERLGLPVAGPVREEHLLCAAQRHLVEASTKPLPLLDEVAGTYPALVQPLGELLDDEASRAVVLEDIPMLRNEGFADQCRTSSIYRMATAYPGISADILTRIGERLNAANGSLCWADAR